MSDGGGEESAYVIATVEVNPIVLEKYKLDCKSSSREKDLTTVKLPSVANPCRIQMWEVYVAAAILILQPHSSVVFAHTEALCDHDEPSHLCEAILKEHLIVGNVMDTTQEATMYSFFDEYFHRKFQISFAKHSLYTYVQEAMDDPLCGPMKLPRVFLLAPHLQAFLLNSTFFEGQYDELIDAMRMAALPVNDVLVDGEKEIGESVNIAWDVVQLYDDPNMILKKHGGWATTKATKILTPKDQLMMKLTGCTLDQIMSGVEVPDSPRFDEDETEQTRRRREFEEQARADAKKDDDESDHPSDFDVDPEHEKIVPLGLTITEMYCLLRGIVCSMEQSSGEFQGVVLGDHPNIRWKDGHMLAAAVLMDLYMRDAIDVHHWTISEGNIAVPYKVEKKKRTTHMDHFLDNYAKYAETIFRDMRLPAHVDEAPIWANLEARGVIDNHRPSWERAYGCGFANVDVWDLARPDLLLDLKQGYLLAARVLYDKDFPDPFDADANDMLMFLYIMQNLFDKSVETIDGMSRVLRERCPPFEKGEMYPPVTMVHAGAVCLGLIEHGFRFASGQSTELAQEAAEFNEEVMERMETKFFMSPKVWEAFDQDQSGEMSMEEFVNGMKSIDVYKDFRRERVPEDVLRMIVADLAERLFHEVDINMDGTLTPAELQIAFKRRRDEAQRVTEQRQWMQNTVKAIAAQAGYKQKKQVEQVRKVAMEMQEETQKKAVTQEHITRNEWAAEVEAPALIGHLTDVDSAYTTNQ